MTTQQNLNIVLLTLRLDVPCRKATTLTTPESSQLPVALGLNISILFLGEYQRALERMHPFQNTTNSLVPNAVENGVDGSSATFESIPSVANPNCPAINAEGQTHHVHTTNADHGGASHRTRQPTSKIAPLTHHRKVASLIAPRITQIQQVEQYIGPCRRIIRF
jgi:hypothetical protein